MFYDGETDLEINTLGSKGCFVEPDLTKSIFFKVF